MALESAARLRLWVGGPGLGKGQAVRAWAQALGLPERRVAVAELHEAGVLAGLGPAERAAWAQGYLALQGPPGLLHLEGMAAAEGPEGEALLALVRLALAQGWRVALNSRVPWPWPWSELVPREHFAWAGVGELVGPPEAWGAGLPEGAPQAAALALGGWPEGLARLRAQPEAGEAELLAWVQEGWLGAWPEALRLGLGPLALWTELDEGLVAALGLGQLAPPLPGQAEPEPTVAFLKRWALVREDAFGRLVWVPLARQALAAEWRRLAPPARVAQAEALVASWVGEHDPLAALLAELAAGRVAEALAIAEGWGERLLAAEDWPGLASLLHALPMGFRLSQGPLLLLEAQLLLAQGELGEALARAELSAQLFAFEGQPAEAFAAWVLALELLPREAPSFGPHLAEAQALAHAAAEEARARLARRLADPR